MERQKATFYLDPKVIRALRIRAAETGEKQSHIVERLLRRELALEEPPAEDETTSGEAGAPTG